MKIKIVSLLSVVVISGCAKTPRTVTAEIPLVNVSHQAFGRSISRDYWSSLNSQSDTALAHEKFHIEVAPPYLSALGLWCRVAHLTSKEQPEWQARRVVCQRKNSDNERAWYLMNDVVENPVDLEW